MIFDRSRHPVVPTLKGVDLLQQAKRILHEQDVFIRMAEQKSNLPSGEFRLAIVPELAPYLLPLFTSSLAKKYPQLELRIFELSTRQMEEFFKDEKLDAALAIAPFTKGFYEEPLFEERFVLYVGPNHPLSKLDEVSWNEIPLEELILQENVRSSLLEKESAGKQLPISVHKIRNIAFESGSLETIRKMIDRNGGITLLPHLAMLYMGERRLKMVREIHSPTLTRTIVFVTPRGFEKNRITKVITKEIRAAIPREVKSR